MSETSTTQAMGVHQMPPSDRDLDGLKLYRGQWLLNSLDQGLKGLGLRVWHLWAISKNILQNGRSVANMDPMELGPNATTQERCPCENTEPLWAPSVSPQWS